MGAKYPERRSLETQAIATVKSRTLNLEPHISDLKPLFLSKRGLGFRV